MIVDRAVCPEKSLSLAWGFEPLHAMLPRSCRLLGVFGSVVLTNVSSNVSSMLHTGHQLSLRSGVASEPKYLGRLPRCPQLATTKQLHH